MGNVYVPLTIAEIFNQQLFDTAKSIFGEENVLSASFVIKFENYENLQERLQKVRMREMFVGVNCKEGEMHLNYSTICIVFKGNHKVYFNASERSTMCTHNDSTDGYNEFLLDTSAEK